MNEETAARGGDIGRFITRDEMIPVLADKLFGLAVGSVSDPIRIGDRYAVFKILDETTAQLNPRQRMRIAEELERKKRGIAKAELVAELRDKYRLEPVRDGIAAAVEALRTGEAAVGSKSRGSRSWPNRNGGEPAQALDDHPAWLCVIESEDGIHWRRPELGLFEFAGSKANNIVLAPDAVAKVSGEPAHAAVFRDDNPDCPPDARFKIVMAGKEGLYLMKSSDGFHFSLMGEQPAITQGTFDSQNLMFWDPVRREYREYHRGVREGVRDIMTATSPRPSALPRAEMALVS